MKKLPIYRIIIGDADGIEKMSLVDSPAVESDFLKFSKEEGMRFSLDEELHIVFGVALRADYPIYRRTDSGYEYYVVFDKENIRLMYEAFMRNPNKVNLQHSKDTDGVYLIQSFIKNTEAGVNPVGFEDISDGSWFVAYKVDNEEVWKQVKGGVFNGFSVEGTFELVETAINMQKDKDLIDELIDEACGE